MKRHPVTTVILAVLIVSAVALVAAVHDGDSLPRQPIAFNHKLHLERVQGIACQDCHSFASSQYFAGIPSKHVCFGCHDPTDEDPEADAGKPRFAELISFAASDGDIPWHRVTASRDDVFFSHRRHVTVAGIECRRCHPRMPDRTSPPTREIVMRMNTCLDCHRETNTSVDCIACHR